MLSIDNVECNLTSGKLRSVFWTQIDKQPIQTLIDTGSTVTAISLPALENIAKEISLYQSDIPQQILK